MNARNQIALGLDSTAGAAPAHADNLGLTAAELSSDLADGKTLADLATADEIVDSTGPPGAGPGGAGQA